VVLAHTEFVASEVARWSGRDVRVIPHPLQLGMIDHGGAGWPFDPPPSSPVALHFGILRRRYKGSEVVVSLAERGVPGWEFALIGVGAPAARPGLFTFDGFVSDATIVRSVRAASAVLLPYRRASQSGAVVLAQALGAPVIASAVGGIPEQVVDGQTGLLIDPGAPAAAWAAALERLSDGAERARMTDAARRAVTRQHERFRTSILELVQ
jgi:glycosyltransferase involved in cell wall biosynthesis